MTRHIRNNHLLRGSLPEIIDPQTTFRVARVTSILDMPISSVSDSQRETIALDYGMNNHQLVTPVRCALLYYFNKRLRLDVAETFDDPKEAPIVIANRSEFAKALRRAGG